jgi:16S rRNA (cytidine1402-2'-O)-methyltransferase
VREITKKFEETVRGTLTEAIAHFKAHEPKGEFVIVVEGYDAKAERRNDSSNEEDEE